MGWVRVLTSGGGMAGVDSGEARLAGDGGRVPSAVPRCKPRTGAALRERRGRLFSSGD